ncbi:molybdopterin-containing oxidoreductase family protein [Sulfurospirillum multivorans]|uniref:Polysulfide reductase, chain A n=2 Tax=Sulfurospirillum multivorans TaxID=66821 RepID=A0AA86APE7_SULMK|nr:molybdopterin-dependent oxidoreductase [Sulfurospirillum multivorans]AHJ14496.1 putative polysulfide reductase, chain A [Sulfurospirillum multivorans DSM 12446]QEH07977.1 putative polysulfide reductase, chain A [Sulfurospirillum multivorans]
MKVEISRRRFLQGSVALSIASGTAFSSSTILASSKEKPQVALMKEVPTICEMCVNKCAAIAHVRNGIVTKLDPNPYFPKSRNMLCARGAAGIHALYDPDRLKYPLIRTGERGEGKYRRATWEEANEYIKDKLVKILEEEKDNRSCIGYCAGEGLAEHTFKTFMSDKFGSSNFLNHSTICLQTAVSGYTLTIGGYGQADLENAKYVIMAGANRAEAILTPDTMDMFKRTRGRGMKLVVVDPRFTNTAMHADTYVQIRPGTDLAFVLALTYVAIIDQVYNRSYVAKNFVDFDKYKKHIIESEYTPEWAEKITGVPAATICKIAHDFMANAPQAVYYQGRRTTWSKNDFQLRRAMALFTALGGGIDVKGGIVFGKKLPLGEHTTTAPMYANAKPRIDKNLAAVVGATGTWVGWRNMVEEGKSPYPIRGMFVYKQNPMLSVPNSAKTRTMFEKMDLVVVIDTMPSDTAMLADVILPECTYLEREDPVQSFAGIEPSIAIREKVIEPMYESKPVNEIMRGLAQKLSKPLWEITKKYDEDVQEELEDTDENEFYEENGFDLAEPFMHDQEETNKHMFVEKYGEEAWGVLRAKGVFYPNMLTYFKKIDNNTYEYYPKDKKFYSVLKLEEEYDPVAFLHDICVNPVDIADLKRSFNTPNKKVECFLGSMAAKGVDPMPVWRDEEYVNVPVGKFKFITGRHAQFTQNATQNNIMLLELMRENYLWINDKEAEALNIQFGDTVEVTSRVGQVQIKAYPTAKIVPQSVFYIHGFGAKSEGLTFAHRNGASDNEIIEDTIEPVHGCANMHETLVSIRRV